MNEDSECVVCGKIVETYCDACGNYICEKHSIKDDSLNSYVFCEKCKKKNKKSITMKKGEIFRGITMK